jgi:hypothetical protein
MNRNLREALKREVTTVAIAAATLVTVGTCFITSSSERPAPYARGAPSIASTIDPCVETGYWRSSTPASESGLQCPVYGRTSG